MASLPAARRDAIAKLLLQLEVDDAFAKLSEHEDLKHTDLPSLDKSAIAALGGDLRATQAFVAGLVSPSASVRRMARKYAPKLAPHGPGAILLLVAECVRPFRKLASPEDGLAGDFGGFATPLRASVIDKKLSFVVKNPTIAVYSPATRLLRETLENLASAAGMTDDRTFVRAFEFIAMITRPFARVAQAPLVDDAPEIAAAGCTALYYAGTLHGKLKEEMTARVKKESPAILAVLERWARHESSVADEAPAGSPEAALRARLHETLTGDELGSSAAILPICAADFLRYTLSKAKAVILYRHIQAGPAVPTEAHKWLHEGLLKSFARENPRETDGPPPSPLPPLAPEGAAAASAPAPAAPVRVEDVPPPFTPHLGPPADGSLGTLVGVAEKLGLPALWRELAKEAEHDWLTEEDAPAEGDPPRDAAKTIEAVRATIRDAQKKSAARDKIATALLGSFSNGHGAYLADEVIEGARWADRLAELLVGLDGPGVVLEAALHLLPPRLIAKHADVWRRAAAALDDRSGPRVLDSLSTILATRGAGLAAIAGPILEWRAGAVPPNGDRELVYSLAILYGSHGHEGRAAAARAIGLAKLPTAESYYRRHLFTAPYHDTFRRAWARRDADFLGAAFSRIAVPIYFKGKRALVPFAETFRFENMAPTEGTAPADKELLLSEVAAFVAKERPDQMREALDRAGEAASFEKGARAILDASPGAEPVEALTPRADAKRIADTVALLEAPKDAAVKSGLEMLVPLAPKLGDQLDSVLRGAERAVASASPGVVQAAAALLGALGMAHADRREDVLRLLEECLMSKNIPTAEEALRALARVLAAPAAKGKKKAEKAEKAKKPGKPKELALSAAARKRIAALAEEEPKRLGKLAAALLA